MADDEQFAAIRGKPTHQGTVEWVTLVRGPRSLCERAIELVRRPVPNGPEQNPGKVDIIPLDRWNELKAQGLIR